MANINENESSARSQCAVIAEWLENGNTITGLEALRMFGCIRLASRIYDLRERGYDIDMQKIVTANGKRVAEYRLKK